MVTISPCAGTLPPGHVSGSDHNAPGKGEPEVELLEELLDEEELDVLLVLFDDDVELEEDELELELDAEELLDEELELDEDEFEPDDEELELELDDVELPESTSLPLSLPSSAAPPQPLVNSRRQKPPDSKKFRAKVNIRFVPLVYVVSDPRVAAEHRKRIVQHEKRAIVTINSMFLSSTTTWGTKIFSGFWSYDFHCSTSMAEYINSKIFELRVSPKN